MEPHFKRRNEPSNHAAPSTDTCLGYYRTYRLDSVGYWNCSSWWSSERDRFYLAYFAVLIVYVIAAEVGYVKMNRIGIVGLSAVGFSWIVGFCDTGAQYSKVSGLSSNVQSGYGLIAAGSILMSMPFIYWIWAYGEPSSKKTGYV
ncbi:hypothetical protein HDU79_004768 [Rhizoclosmatium sp. JEL0117]|nr:hypothetical protein HDU79_004768 [Rhizoclosmatium sp. JEL0117]